MNKKAFVKLANDYGITDIRYSGKTKTFFIKGADTITSAFVAFVNNLINHRDFKLQVTTQPISKLYKGLGKLLKKRAYMEHLYVEGGLITTVKA